MNRDLTLLIQAYLDGELAGRQARRVAEWIETDAQAGALYQELRQTRDYLRSDVELPRTVPATREFFWSQIQRDIEQAERKETVPTGSASLGWWTRWRRYAAPMAAAALVALLAVPTARYFGDDHGDPYTSYLAEVENPSEEMGSYSFRTRSGNMFVVWLYDKAPDSSDFFEEGGEVVAQ